MSNSDLENQLNKEEYETLDLTGALTPSRMTSSIFYPYEVDDIKTQEDLQSLIMLMFRFPNRDFYLYQERDGARNEIILTAEKLGDIEFVETEFFHYRHPNYSKNYLHIEVRDDNYEWSWQKEVVDKGPMYIRTTLQLSTRKRMEIESWHKVQMEDEFRRKLAEAACAYDVFISYSSADSKEGNMLYNTVTQAGGRAFMDKKDLSPGEHFEDKIRDALVGSKEIWILLSPTSLKSEWVLSEWGAAWALKKTIIPILHQCSVKDLPDRLRKIQFIDFYRHTELVTNRNWGKDKSQQ